jgi:hypothetical protein
MTSMPSRLSVGGADALDANERFAVRGLREASGLTEHDLRSERVDPLSTVGTSKNFHRDTCYPIHCKHFNTGRNTQEQ